MGSKKLNTLLVLLGIAVAAVPLATGAQKVAVAKSPNYTDAQRPARSIDRIVIHVTEGHFWGSVRTLRRHGGSSAHYVVGTEGQIVQMVSTSDIAWHAGNWNTNVRSIGIEHEGWTYRKGSITDAEYDASARLVAHLVRKFGIPVDRKHIIGHHEVPDPYHPGEIGGIDGHTDPGPYWRWNHYLDLIREYAEHPAEFEYVKAVEPKPVVTRRVASRARASKPRVVADRVVRCGFRPSVHSTTLYGGQAVAGLVAWRAKACGRRIHRVDFFVDGKLKWVDREKPFAFARGRGLNTTNLANGWHTISMRGYGPRGHRVRKRIRIRVDNSRFAVRFRGISPQQSLRGKVRVAAQPNAAAWVALLVDGKVVRRGKPAPHSFAFDTTTLANGTHRLELQAEALDGRRASASIPVVVLNGEPTATFAAHVDWQSLADWQIVAGPVVWRALASGDVAQVEFWIDGRLRSVDLTPPYVFGPDEGVWDASAESPGSHELTVKAVGADGHSSESTVTVFVEPPK